LIDLYIFTSSLKEFFRVKRIAWWLLVAVAVYFISWTFAHRLPGVSARDAYILLSASLVFRILPLCAAIFSTAVINQEVTQRTIVYLLTRPIPRWKLLVYRALAASVVVAFVSIVTDLSVCLAVGTSQASLMAHDIQAIAVGSLAYTTLFTLVSLFVNKPMVVCLLFSFVWETAVPEIPGDLYRVTISGYLTSIAHRPVMDSPGGALDALAGLLGVNVIPSGVAWAAMLGFAAFCLGFGAFWFSNFEYMAREDD
jgi:ABC-2 type transport system permease protein